MTSWWWRHSAWWVILVDLSLILSIRRCECFWSRGGSHKSCDVAGWPDKHDAPKISPFVSVEELLMMCCSLNGSAKTADIQVIVHTTDITCDAIFTLAISMATNVFPQLVGAMIILFSPRLLGSASSCWNGSSSSCFSSTSSSGIRPVSVRPGLSAAVSRVGELSCGTKTCFNGVPLSWTASVKASLESDDVCTGFFTSVSSGDGSTTFNTVSSSDWSTAFTSVSSWDWTSLQKSTFKIVK